MAISYTVYENCSVTLNSRNLCSNATVAKTIKKSGMIIEIYAEKFQFDSNDKIFNLPSFKIIITNNDGKVMKKDMFFIDEEYDEENNLNVITLRGGWGQFRKPKLKKNINTSLSAQ